MYRRYTSLWGFTRLAERMAHTYKWSLEALYCSGKNRQVVEGLGEERNHGRLRAWVGCMQPLHGLKEGQEMEV